LVFALSAQEPGEKKYDARVKAVFGAIRALMAPARMPRRPIGFLAEERGPHYQTRRSARQARPQ